ncbi:acyl-CoA synthetase [Enemella evansiae]|uniref:acyl-CoA synthetase n=1 Tax=Enemella evansiae TaxID=2016499 RepID=UPI000B97A407|nr:acyl-CoA synthetase [Enemella evansiae]OYO03377.1 acyl-CoA synthetase [Enemella evansiae]
MTARLLDALIADRGHHPLTFADGSLSRTEFRRAAAAVAESVTGRERVAVFARPTLRTALAVVGGLLAGVSVVPVPVDSGPAELAYLLGDSQAEAWLGEAPEDAGELPVIAVDPAARSDADFDEPAGSAVALILYTSGTTGSPKGVLLSRAVLAAGLDGLAEAWQWSDQDVLVHGLPLFHVHGLVLGMLGPLRVGSGLVHTGRPKPELYAAAAGTMYFGVPTVWTRVTRDPEAARRLAHARLLVSGSAPLPVPVFEKLQELTGIEPVERYGMSETLITISARADGEKRPGWVGVPIAGVRSRLRDDDGNEVPHDGESIGNLQITGDTLFSGYLGREQATEESFTADGWFATGDLAAIDADGFHRIVGRASVDLIKSGGYRVGAGEVETALLAHPMVREVAVIGVPDDDLGQRIVAHVVAEDGEVSAEELIQAVAGELSVHKRPREIVFVESLPRNAMGKVQKKQLLENR